MHSKLAGHLPLADMIANVIDQSRSKIAAADEKEKVKKLVAYEKKEHGGKIPSEKEEKEEHEKKSSAVIDFQDPEQVEKLASALDTMAELLVTDDEETVDEKGEEEVAKEAADLNGGEKKQGGTQLPVMPAVGGKQAYTGNKAKTQIPAPTVKATNDNPGAANAMATDEGRAPGGTGAKYPAKGVLKTAAEQVLAKIQEERAKEAGAKDVAQVAVSRAKKIPGMVGKHLERVGKRSAEIAMRTGKGSAQNLNPTHAKAIGGAVYGTGAAAAGGAAVGAKKLHDKHKEKKSEAVDFILSKIAEVKGGGEVLANTAPVPSNPGRQLISSNAAPAAAKKVDAKSPRKKELAQVLNEPAMTSSTDNTVQQNLRNASKGGVKIAAVKAELQKIASDPSDPRHEALMEAVKAKQASKSTPAQ